jgi:CubicO group peptidase (beta-lactamase class C family)
MAEAPERGILRVMGGLRGGSGAVALDGSVHPDFVEMVGVLRSLIARHGGGGSVCVYHRGRCVVDLWGGVRDEAGRPWAYDTMAPSFSTTKGVATTLLHVLRDRGLLDYDDPVSKHWPGFARSGKARITVRQVLAHQSGLYHIRQMIDHADRMLDWDYMVRAIESAAPIHEPGARTGYHGLTYGFLVGELAQRVTGTRFPELVRREIAGPLGLDGMYVGAPESELHRAARLMWPRLRIAGRGLPEPALGDWLEHGALWLERAGRALRLPLGLGSVVDALAPRGISSFDFGARETLRAAIPAASGLFTARSLARMYAALAGGGALDGVRLLSPETLREAARPQPATRHHAVIPFDLRWRLGYHGVFTTRGAPRRAFGHFGFGGSGAWADPSRNLAVALIVNAGMGTPLGDLRIARVGAAALAGAARARRGADTRAPVATAAAAAPLAPGPHLGP